MTDGAMQVVVRRSVQRVSWHDADLHEAMVDQLRCDPDSLLSSGTLLRDQTDRSLFAAS